MAFRFIANSRGGENLIVEEYLYRIDKRNKNNPNVRYWKCCGRDAHSCAATAITDGNNLLSSSPFEMHCHSDDVIEIARRGFKTDVKNKVG
jgi:FLYWCH zinc finger domain